MGAAAAARAGAGPEAVGARRAMPGPGSRADEGGGGGGEGAGPGREPVRLCGYLQKLSGKGPLRGYRSRWFVLDARRCCLYYFKSPQDALPLGRLDIADACFSLPGPDEAAEPGAAPPALFQVHSAGVVTVLKVGARAAAPAPGCPPLPAAPQSLSRGRTPCPVLGALPGLSAVPHPRGVPCAPPRAPICPPASRGCLLRPSGSPFCLPASRVSRAHLPAPPHLPSRIQGCPVRRPWRSGLHVDLGRVRSPPAPPLPRLVRGACVCPPTPGGARRRW